MYDFSNLVLILSIITFHAILVPTVSYSTGQQQGRLDFHRPLVFGLSSPRRRSAGSFPEQRLVIEPSNREE